MRHSQITYRRIGLPMRRPQVTCRCAAYPFPHRLTGGKCSGAEWAGAYFLWVGTACDRCNANNNGCEVAAGIESITECEGAHRPGAMQLPVDESRLEEMLGREEEEGEAGWGWMLWCSGGPHRERGRG